MFRFHHPIALECTLCHIQFFKEIYFPIVKRTQTQILFAEGPWKGTDISDFICHDNYHNNQEQKSICHV